MGAGGGGGEGTCTVSSDMGFEKIPSSDMGFEKIPSSDMGFEKIPSVGWEEICEFLSRLISSMADFMPSHSYVLS